jgi:predicted RNA binding protein YcfA (HicA-like mRNA interferase family)
MPERKITPVHYKKLIKIFELDGFVLKRKKEAEPETNP